MSGKERNRSRRAAYKQQVARHAVFPMLDRVLLDLGGNIRAKNDDLAPRRAPRQASVPPGYDLQVCPRRATAR
jgi:hypothetical protein